MNVLLFGKRGQVGHELLKKLQQLGAVVAFDSTEVDFRDDEQVKHVLRQEQPDIIVNAAAYTAVDNAESESVLAHQVNATAVGHLASYANDNDALLVHFSTDYVFDGTKDGRYNEQDLCNPLSVYGTSKRDGEERIIESNCKHLILRTSWVYSNRGTNFIKTILKLATSKAELNVINDQVGVPTSAQLIATVTSQILSKYVENPVSLKEAYGTYHLSPSGETNWHEYAKFIVRTAMERGEHLQLPLEAIHPISTSQYAQAAIRPKNSLLDTSKLRSAFQIELPDWQVDVEETICDLLTSRTTPYNI